MPAWLRWARFVQKGPNPVRRRARFVQKGPNPPGRRARFVQNGPDRGSWQCRYDRVDLGSQSLRGAAGVSVEHDAPARRQQRRSPIPVPCRLHRTTEVATLRSDPRDEKWKLRGAAHLGDRLRSGGADDQAHIAVAIQLVGQSRHVQEYGLPSSVQVLEVLSTGIRRPADHIHSAILEAGELLDGVAAEVRADRGRVHGQGLKYGSRVRPDGVVPVTSLGVEWARGVGELLM